FKLNSLSMKDNGKASTYISQFRTLQLRIDWNDAAFAFHFQKGLPSRITDQLALTGQRLKMLQQLIDQTIELNNCYHNKIRSNKKKKFPVKPFTPLALTSAPRSKKTTKMALCSTRKDNSIWRSEQGGKEKDFVCIVVGNMSETLVSNGSPKATNYPLFREFILFDSSNQPYRALLESGANMSFISLEFAKRQSFPLTDIKCFPVYLKTKWTFHFSSFPSFKWDIGIQM
ncbi:uncharacterized protein VP01_7877g1, partial [Puccinia sorghi]